MALVGHGKLALCGVITVLALHCFGMRQQSSADPPVLGCANAEPPDWKAVFKAEMEEVAYLKNTHGAEFYEVCMAHEIFPCQYVVINDFQYIAPGEFEEEEIPFGTHCVLDVNSKIKIPPMGAHLAALQEDEYDVEEDQFPGIAYEAETDDMMKVSGGKYVLDEDYLENSKSVINFKCHLSMEDSNGNGFDDEGRLSKSEFDRGQWVPAYDCEGDIFELKIPLETFMKHFRSYQCGQLRSYQEEKYMVPPHMMLWLQTDSTIHFDGSKCFYEEMHEED